MARITKDKALSGVRKEKSQDGIWPVQTQSERRIITNQELEELYRDGTNIIKKMNKKRHSRADHAWRKGRSGSTLRLEYRRRSHKE